MIDKHELHMAMATLDRALYTLTELDHDHRDGPEDGCSTCFEVAQLQSELHHIYKFIQQKYE